MNPDDLQRELQRLTSAIDAPASAWSSIAQRGRVRRRWRRTAVAAVVAVVVLAGSAGSLSARGGEARVATPTTTHTPQASLSPSAGPQSFATAEPTQSDSALRAAEPPSLVAVVRYGELDLYRRSGNNLRLARSLTRQETQHVAAAFMSPAKDRIVYLVNDQCSSSLWSVQLDGSQRHAIYESSEGLISAPAISSDGSHLAFGLLRGCPTEAPGNDPPAPRTRVVVVNLDTGTKVWTSRTDSGAIQALGWEPAKLTFVYSAVYCCDATVEVRRVELTDASGAEHQIDPPADCDWRSATAELFVTYCYGSRAEGLYAGTSATAPGPLRLDPQVDLTNGQFSFDAASGRVLAVANTSSGDGSDLLAGDVVRGGRLGVLLHHVDWVTW